MLKKSGDKIRDCYIAAADARHRALAASNPETKATLFKLEDAWLRLARGHELSESIAPFRREVRQFLGLE